MRGTNTQTAPFLRCLLVWAAVTAGGAALAAWLVPQLDSLRTITAPGTTLDEALAPVAVLALLGCLLWFWLGTTAVVIGAARGQVGRGLGLPTGVRRVVLAACGVAVLSTMTAPAMAVPVHLPTDHANSARTGQSAVGESDVLRGLPLPDRMAGRAAPDTHQGPSHDSGTVTVRSGDSLWGIAANHLSDSASDADIDELWREIYAANRAVVGSDPDLILPGQHLQVTVKENGR